jgi:hypothetical protein
MVAAENPGPVVCLNRRGFSVVRAAARKGVAALVAFDSVSIRLISVKVNSYATAVERERLALVPLAACGREIWRFVSRRREPLIERL